MATRETDLVFAFIKSIGIYLMLEHEPKQAGPMDEAFEFARRA